MSEQNKSLINRLNAILPEGLVVDAAWLRAKGYSTQLQYRYVNSGWLESLAHGVFRRPPASLPQGRSGLTWQQVVISLQTVLDYSPLIVGGRTALELQGYAHYLRRETAEVYLYGPKAPPNWVYKLPLAAIFHYRNSGPLFKNDPVTKGLTSLKWNVQTGDGLNPSELRGGGFEQITWGQWDWPLTLSSPERAILQMLDELPKHETFEQADALFSGLVNLRPSRLQKLLEDCDSVKVKRLFFYFSDRHQHAWLKRLDKSRIDFGSGKRALVPGGVLDRTYLITVPGDLDGVR